MGLDTTHGCWHGAYSAFMRWRTKIAEVAGLPPLELMEGFFDPKDPLGNPFHSIAEYCPPSLKSRIDRYCRKFPIRWNCLKENPLHELLYHSDCDGIIEWEKCDAIANELEKLIPLLPDEDTGGHIGNWREKTKCFVDGLRLASSKKENVEFG